MRSLKTISVILDILLLVPGVCSSPWRVTFTSPPPCVLRGSSVDIGCSYDYDYAGYVTDAIWYKDGKELIRDSQPRQGRFQYTGNKHHDCTLRIKNIEDSDMGHYEFRFWTTQDTYASHTTLPGLTAQLQNGDTVSEGGEVKLYCLISCDPRPKIVWFKDGRKIPNPKFNAKIQDAGDYQCAVEGQETWKSAAVRLDVQYGPQNVVLSVSPQGDVVKGSSVTLSCSSSGSNPAIHRYSLLKDNTRVAQNKISTIDNIQTRGSGTYSCQAENIIASITSPRVTLNVHYPPENTLVSVNPPGEVVEGSTVTLTCSCDANPPVDTYTWYRDGGSTAISTGPQLVKANVSRADSGPYTCRGTNKHGSQTSSPRSIGVLYAPVNVLVEVSAPDGAAGVSNVTLTCRSDANPPVDNQDYTWYKSTPGSSSSLVGSGQVLLLASLQSSQAGLYVCHTRNSVGGGNGSTEVLLHVVTTNHAALISGVAASLFVLILVIPIAFWVRRKTANADQEPASVSGVSGRGLASVPGVSGGGLASVPGASGRASDPPISQVHQDSSYQCTSTQINSGQQEQDVHYSSVMFKALPRTHADQNNAAPQHTMSGDRDDVIYSTVKEDVSAIYSNVDRTRVNEDVSAIYSSVAIK